jgi:phosphocarrier protein HPr
MENRTIVERRVIIRNRAGLHARPAGEFVKISGRFAAEIEVEKDGVQVNGKSILGVMMLAAEQGAEIVIRCNGVDAESAAEALVALVDRGFGEG